MKVKKGLILSPHFTKGTAAAKLIQWQKGANVGTPEGWSDTAVDVARSRYFRINAGEKTIRQLVDRVCLGIHKSALQQKYFSSAKAASVFIEELKYILWTQRAAFNSPVWFNVGVGAAYGLSSHSEHWAFDFKSKKIKPETDAYRRPQSSACFIQSIEDNLESIFTLVKNEARLFKYGSGSGTNFSNLRSRYEEIQVGGSSSGLISFLEVLDKGAGAIKSGGTTRRAAKMVIVDCTHPEILDFIHWKRNEERKAKALMKSDLQLSATEAYQTVSGQNANNSVRVTDEFMKAVHEQKPWKLKSKKGKELQVLKATDLWQEIARAAWECADPGLQYHDTINQWNPCLDAETIYASNPCSEFMFLNETACNLSSINLLKYISSEGFDLESYMHTIRVLIIAQDLLVDESSYPTEKIAEKTHQYRPLGLGFTNWGAVLMSLGIPYDSDQARQGAALVSALLTGQAYKVSAELAQLKAPFPAFMKTKKSFKRVIQKHKNHLKSMRNKSQHTIFSENLWLMAENIWDDVEKKCLQGFRNAQVTAIAPTGTISLLMDCTTTGIEPEFSLLKTKTLIEGKVITMVNQIVEKTLHKLGYEDPGKILKYLQEHQTLVGAPLKKEHRPIFATAVGDEPLSSQSHLLMMAAVQPFISGGISKTVNLPSRASVDDVQKIYEQAWELGLKSVSIYRDSSKELQPLQAVTACGSASDCG